MPEQVVTRFEPDRHTYTRDHIKLAVIATVVVTIVLYLVGVGHVWVGLVATPAAILVRGFYLATEELAAIWELTDQSVNGPGGRVVALADLERVRTLGSAVQLVTRSGDKHLLKYLPDPKAVANQIEAERNK